MPLVGAAVHEDFNGPLANWHIVQGTWSVESGHLVATTQGDITHSDEAWIYYTGERLGPALRVDLDVNFAATPSTGDGKHGGIMLATDPSPRWSTSGYEMDWFDQSQAYRIVRFDSGQYTFLRNASGQVAVGETHHWSIEVTNTTVRFSVDGVTIAEAADGIYRVPFHLGLWADGGGERISFSNVTGETAETATPTNARAAPAAPVVAVMSAAALAALATRRK
jgi:hypothetical protein